MQLIRWVRGRSCRRGSVTVEFALVTTFFLLPLLAGAADFLTIITAQAQLNTALQALYSYAWSNSGAGTGVDNTTGSAATGEQNIIDVINGTSPGEVNGASIFTITLVPGNTTGSFSNQEFLCVGTGTTPAPTSNSLQTSSTCGANQTAESFVQFTVKTTVHLPFPLPLHLANPLTLSATGAVQA